MDHLTDQLSRVPTTGASSYKTWLQTLAKVFYVSLSKIDESRAFSANDQILSREPQMTSLAETHPQIECRSADNAQAFRQINSAGLHHDIDFEISIVSDFDLDEI